MHLLITGAWQGFSSCKEQLIKAGHEICFMQWEKDPLPCDPEWVEGIIGNGIFLNHRIEQFTNLKYVQLTSAGFDRIPMDYVLEHGIEIHNARGVYSIPMAEFALGGVLQLYKQFPTFAKSQQKHEWNKIRSLQELDGKTVLIIGCGNVGTECAKRFQAFDCRVMGIDLYPREDAHYEEILPLTALDDELPKADIIVMTVPMTEDTRHLIDRQRFMKLKQNAVIVNISRGRVMDQKAFIELKGMTAEKGGRPDLMAVLDVFETEPLEEISVLWEMDRVIVTPHNSFEGEKNQERLKEVILDYLL